MVVNTTFPRRGDERRTGGCRGLAGRPGPMEASGQLALTTAWPRALGLADTLGPPFSWKKPPLSPTLPSKCQAQHGVQNRVGMTEKGFVQCEICLVLHLATNGRV